MKNSPIKMGDRYIDTICGIRLFMSPSIGSMPVISAIRPIMPSPITMAP